MFTLTMQLVSNCLSYIPVKEIAGQEDYVIYRKT